MPTKYFRDQFDDEEVLYVFRKHPVVMRKGLIWASLGMLAGPLIILIWTYAAPNNPPSLNMFYLSLLGSLILAVLLMAPAYMAWHFSIFIVTDQRFIQITQKGFFHRNVSDIGLNHIQTVNYEVSGVEATLLGYGTMSIQTYMGDLVIHYLHHPAKIQKKLAQILREEGITPESYAEAMNEREVITDEE